MVRGGEQEPAVLLAIGDSVMWGQGLEDSSKFYRRVCQQLSLRPEYKGLVSILSAHSGATVVVEDATADIDCPGEVPKTKPTVLAQCNRYEGDPSAVQLVLVDGGINDVKVERIVSPFTSADDLSSWIEQCCHDDMVTLLTKVGQKFTCQNCRIIVVGYYPILSGESNPLSIPKLLTALGHDFAAARDRTARGLALSDPVDLALKFWRESDSALQGAVADANKVTGVQIDFVSPEFSPRNSLFAPDSCLWEINLDLSAQDPVREQREKECQKYSSDLLECALCDRASVGHPNVAGAQKYAQAILELLGNG